MSRVSIIIPAYNTEEYIGRAIESSIKQTFSDIDIVIVDDGSIDNTWSIICTYSAYDSRVIGIRQSNTGVSAARNRGMNRANGDYYLFLDSDDWLEPEAVRILLESQESDSNRLVCSERYFASMNPLGDIKKERQGVLENEEEITAREAMYYTCRDSKFHLTSACYKLFSKTIINDNEIYFSEDIGNWEDGLFVFRYLQKIESVRYINEPLWNILERPGSATSVSFNEFWLTALMASEEMVRLAGTEKRLIDYLKVCGVNLAVFLQIAGLTTNLLSKNGRKMLNDYIAVNSASYIERYGFIGKMKLFFLRQTPATAARILLKLRFFQ